MGIAQRLHEFVGSVFGRFGSEAPRHRGHDIAKAVDQSSQATGGGFGAGGVSAVGRHDHYDQAAAGAADYVKSFEDDD